MVDFAYSLAMWAKYAYVDSAVLHAALRLNLFTQVLAAETITIPQLAHSIKASERGVRVLVEPLVSSKVLTMDAAGGLSFSSSELAHALQDTPFVASLMAAAEWWGPANQLLTAIRTNTAVSHQDQTWDLLTYYQQLFLHPPSPQTQAPGRADFYDRVARGFLRTQIIICLAELNLFDYLEKGPVTLTSLAQMCQADENSLGVFLELLIHLGICTSDGTTYQYHPDAKRSLDQYSRASYSQQGMRLVSIYWQALGELDTAVLHDKRTLNLHNTPQGQEYHLALARYNTGIFPFYFRVARLLPAALRSVRSLENLTICDIGAGSGVWGIAFAHKNPTSQVTFLDTETVLTQTRRNIQRLGLTPQAHFWADDLREADLGTATFDIIILGQICNTQHPEDLQTLFSRIFEALRPGGYLVIADLMLNEQRDDPLDYLYFAVKGFVSTPGSVLSIPEYFDLLDKTGFNTYHHYQLPGMELILAGPEEIALPETTHL